MSREVLRRQSLRKKILERYSDDKVFENKERKKDKNTESNVDNCVEASNKKKQKLSTS